MMATLRRGTASEFADETATLWVRLCGGKCGLRLLQRVYQMQERLSSLFGNNLLSKSVFSVCRELPGLDNPTNRSILAEPFLMVFAGVGVTSALANADFS